MWTEDEQEQVRELLRSFNGASEVCATLGTDPDDLDDYSIDAFGVDFSLAQERYSAQGRAAIRNTLMAKAQEGDMKALDMLARAQLGMGAVEIRKNRIKEGDDGDDDEAYLAAVIASATRPTV